MRSAFTHNRAALALEATRRMPADIILETRHLTNEFHAPGERLLGVRDLNAWYGESHILHGVDFDVLAGEVVTLLGRNGAGKTTTLKSIMGVVPRRTGSIVFEGEQIVALASNRIARRGIAWCP